MGIVLAQSEVASHKSSLSPANLVAYFRIYACDSQKFEFPDIAETEEK